MDETEQPKDSSNRTPFVIGAAVVAVAIILAIALLTPKSSPGPSNTANSATQNTSTKDMAGVATIIFTNDGFSPSKLTVKKGTIVTVENQSSDSMQFSSGEHPTHKEDPEINMAELAPGEKGTFTVSVVGTHSFHDHLDDTNTGTLVVTD